MRQLPDSLGLDDVVKDTVAEIGKAYAEFAAKQALASASEVLRDLAADTAGILMGAVCKALLQVILRREAAITAKLDSLIREPALTGINVGFEAFNGSTVEADAAEFRQRRLQFAIERLDVARTLSRRSKDTQFVLVSLLQGLFLTQVRGGSALARERFQEVVPVLSNRAEALSKKVASLRRRAAEAYREADLEQQKQDRYGENAMDVFVHPATHGWQAGVLRAAAKLNDQECEQLQQGLDRIRQMTEIILAYCGAHPAGVSPP